MARHNTERTIELLAKPKSQAVVEELIELNKGLIGAQLKKFGFLNDHDAISFAYEALYKAICTYDSKKASCFSTYATVCIYNRLGSHLRNLKNTINSSTISYDTTIDENGATFEDVLHSDETADGRILQRQGVAQIHSAVISCYDRINSPVQKQILKLWITSKFTMTHMSIAAQVNCSQTYVSQVINKFRGQIKNKLGGS